MILEALAQILVEADLGVIGESIFMHRMDGETQRGMMLRLPLDGTAIDHNLPGYYKTRLQVVLRDRTQSAGDALTPQIAKALTIYRRDLFKDNVKFARINHLLPSTQPSVYPRTPGQGIEWSLNFILNYVQH